MSAARPQFQDFWRRLSRLDIVALVDFCCGHAPPVTSFRGGAISFVKYLALLAGIYLVVRMIAWGRNRLLWSLRNRLIVAYLFIAVVPILLIMTFVVLAGKFSVLAARRVSALRRFAPPRRDDDGHRAAHRGGARVFCRRG